MKVSYLSGSLLPHNVSSDTYDLHGSAGAKVGQESGNSAQTSETGSDGVNDQTASETFDDHTTGSGPGDFAKQG
jgi:hypothetical protein